MTVEGKNLKIQFLKLEKGYSVRTLSNVESRYIGNYRVTLDIYIYTFKKYYSVITEDKSLVPSLFINKDPVKTEKALYRTETQKSRNNNTNTEEDLFHGALHG